LGEVQHIDVLKVIIPDVFSLFPLLPEEGQIVEVSTDLKNWEEITYLSSTEMNIEIGKSVRYLRFRNFPQQVREIEGYSDGKKMDRSLWKASNLFPHPRFKKAQKAWKKTIVLDEIPANSYLCVAINGKHGKEGAYVAAKIDGELIGAPDRAPSMLCNPWEGFSSRREANYTYYIPVNENYIGKEIEVFVLGYDKENLGYASEMWITAYPFPWEKKTITLERKNDSK